MLKIYSIFKNRLKNLIKIRFGKSNIALIDYSPLNKDLIFLINNRLSVNKNIVKWQYSCIFTIIEYYKI